jgi:hypothetical protein
VRKSSLAFAIAALCALGLAALAGHAAASDLSGRIVLGAYAAPEQAQGRPTFYWEAENGFKEVRGDRVDAARELAVVLVGKGALKAPDRVEIPFVGGSLLPSTLVVGVGTTILFRNEDEVAHELFGAGLDAFPAEAISPRGRRSVKLNETGSWALRDQLIPHVEGHLHVLSDLLAVAQLDDTGRFSFGDVPAGSYTLKVFHADKEIASQQVEVTAKATAIPPITLGAGSESESP